MRQLKYSNLNRPYSQKLIISMEVVELLNQMNRLRNEALNKQAPKGTVYKQTDWVNPSVYTGFAIKTVNGRQTAFENDKLEYLKDFIVDFLLNVEALKQPDIVKGYHNAIGSIVHTKNGYGEKDNIIYRFNGRKNWIRIADKKILDPLDGEYDRLERSQLEYWNPGCYPIVETVEDFYNWFVGRFGEVKLPEMKSAFRP